MAEETEAPLPPIGSVICPTSESQDFHPGTRLNPGPLCSMPSGCSRRPGGERVVAVSPTRPDQPIEFTFRSALVQFLSLYLLHPPLFSKGLLGSLHGSLIVFVCLCGFVCMCGVRICVCTSICLGLCICVRICVLCVFVCVHGCVCVCVMYVHGKCVCCGG